MRLLAVKSIARTVDRRFERHLVYMHCAFSPKMVLGHWLWTWGASALKHLASRRVQVHSHRVLAGTGWIEFMGWRLLGHHLCEIRALRLTYSFEMLERG